MSLEWNLGTSRIQFIGELVNKVRVSHYNVEKKRQVKNLRTYRNLLRELYFELNMYVEGWGEYKPDSLEDNIEDVFSETGEELEDRRKEEQLNDKTNMVFERLELVDQAVNNARKGEGLDIPQKVEEDPENAGVEGLQS